MSSLTELGRGDGARSRVDLQQIFRSSAAVPVKCSEHAHVIVNVSLAQLT